MGNKIKNTIILLSVVCALLLMIGTLNAANTDNLINDISDESLSTENDLTLTENSIENPTDKVSNQTITIDDESDTYESLDQNSKLGISDDENVCGDNNGEDLLGSPYFNLQKTVLTPVVEVGDDVYFEIYVQNTGWGAYTGQWITVNDWFDEGLTYIDYTPNPGPDGKDWAQNYGNVGIVEDQYGKRLVVNYNAWGNFQPYYSFSFTTHFKATKAGILNNTAHIWWQNNWWEQGNEVFSNASVTVGEPSLNITKTVQDPVVGLGDDVYFDIFIENNGSLPYQDDIIYINDWFDEGLEYVDYTINPDKNGNIWTQNYQDVSIWDFEGDPYGKRLVVQYKAYGNWEPGSTINFTVHFKAKKLGQLNNSAQIFWKWKKWGDEDNHEWIEEWGNSSVLVGEPKFSLNKTCNNETVEIGDMVSFTITVTNTGILNLTGVYIKDCDFTGGLKYSDYSDKELWTFDGNDTWYYNGVLAPGESVSLNLTFEATSAGVQNNTAIAGHNLTNETLNSTDNVTVIEKENPVEPEEDPDVDPEDDPDEEESEPSVSKKVDSQATGNPLFVLLLCLMAMCSVPIRNKK